METDAPGLPPARPAPASNASRLLTGCALILLAACFVFYLSGVLVRLATRGELVLRQAGLEETRLWLARQPESAGLGLSDTRRIAGEQAENRVCPRTRIRFLLWRSDGSRTALEECRCYDLRGEAWIAGPSCTAPGGLP